jgi:putative ABC transport system permease protein
MMRERVLRLLLQLYPAQFRRRYGAAMLDFLEQRLQERPGVAGWVPIVWDHVSAALAEHVRILRSRHRTRPSLSSLRDELVHAWRSATRRRSFAAIVIATVALGVGANTAIFSVVYGILLRPLPYPDAARVVDVAHDAPYRIASAAEFVDYQRDLQTFESLAAYYTSEGNLAGDDDPERITSAVVSPEFFTVLGVAPQLGRTFAADEHLTSPGDPGDVIVISHALWQRRFAGDPDVIGRAISYQDRQRTVIGVMPEHVAYPSARTDAWFPLPRIRTDSLEDRARRYLYMVGRLRTDVELPQALAEARFVMHRAMQDNITRYDPARPLLPVITPVAELLLGNTKPFLWSLLGAVALVLLIACVNVANLLLTREEGRRAEIALRAALGASRTRLFTQLALESLVLAVAGGVLGVLLALAGTRALLSAAPATIPRLDEIGMSWHVLAYAVAVSLIAGLMFGVMPAWRISREAPAQTLKRGTRGVTHGGSQRARRALVVAEVAISVVLLSSAGLLLRSLLNLQRQDIGFDTSNVLTAKITPNGNLYDEQRATLFYDQLLERIRAMPDVQYAAASAWLPVVDSGGSWGILAEGQSYETVREGPTAVPQQVTTDYFRTMRIPLIRGREFTGHDRAAGPYVAIVSRSLARQLWPGANPIGKRLRVGNGQTFMTVVGEAADIRTRGFNDIPDPTMYVPYAQTHVSAYFMPRRMSLLIRTQNDPLHLAEEVRAIVHSLDAGVPVSNVRTLEQVVGTSIASRSFATLLIGAFAVLALVLAGIGIAGVIAYGVSQRSFEIGVRLALGAARTSTLQLVLRDSMRMALLGIVIGLAGAAWIAKALRSLLFGVSTVDVRTLAAVSAALLLVVLIATIVPARRAMAVDPTDVLRAG